MEVLHTCLYILVAAVDLFLEMLLLAMFVRALFSWFASEDNRIHSFLISVTEPFILPVRAFLVRFNLLTDSPIDFSFMITSLLIWFISILLPGVRF